MTWDPWASLAQGGLSVICSSSQPPAPWLLLFSLLLILIAILLCLVGCCCGFCLGTLVGSSPSTDSEAGPALPRAASRGVCWR